MLAWLPGRDAKLRDEFILVGAHFDHLGKMGDSIYPGADDNASGVAGLLAIAKACAKGGTTLRRSVLFVAFGAEEQSLRGSRYFAAHPPRSLTKLITMINLDMIGRPRLLDQKALAWPKKLVGIPDEPAVGVLGTDQSPELAAIARAVFTGLELPLFAPEDFGVLANTIKKMSEGRSDHAPFQQRGIPFLFFSTSEHDDYHKPTDTVDKVDGETIRRIAEGVFRTLLAVDRADGRPTFVKAAPKPKAEKRADPDKPGNKAGK
jgi:Zn-dependent M28 family amino/carboxypeptidase